jgi:uncharacterized protein YjbI with pentapeptide repeats
MLPNAGAAMADEEHLARLKKDIDAWNAWRLANTEVPPDLTGADLTGAKLVSANLTGAKLVSANLTGADLTGANLIHANLSRATLFNANLNRANLFNANLIRANLTAANLTAANLTSANLNGAKLADALFRETVFGDSDLTSVTGLETCNHYGPSVIDHRTLQKSRSLPMLFLRGVGLPERLIEYLPTLLNQAIQYYSCFISYSTKDQEFAERIHSDLQNKGVRCWFAPHDMPIGGKILDEIDTSVRLRDKLLLILSENSINSEWVEIEVTTAFEEERKHRKIVLFPIRLDDAVIDAKEPWAGQLRRRNIGDFRKWKDHDAYTRSFDRVLRDLAPKPKRP